MCHVVERSCECAQRVHVKISTLCCRQDRLDSNKIFVPQSGSSRPRKLCFVGFEASPYLRTRSSSSGSGRERPAGRNTYHCREQVAQASSQSSNLVQDTI